MVRSLTLVLSLLFVASSFAQSEAPVPTESPEDLEEARRLLEEGNSHFRDGLYDKAAESYTAAIVKADRPVLHLNLTSTLVRQGQEYFPKARFHLEKALKGEVKPLNDELRAHAETLLAILDGSLAQIEVSSPEEKVIVRVDGEQVLKGKGTAKVFVVGNKEHTVLAERDEYKPSSHTHAPAPGQVERIVIELKPKREAVYARRWKNWIPWTVVGAGAALVLGGIPLQIASSNNFDKYDERFAAACSGINCYQQRAEEFGDTGIVEGANCGTENATGNCSIPSHYPDLPELEDKASTQNTLAVSMFALGGAALIAGGAMFYLNQERLVSPEEGGLQILPTGGPGEAGVSAHWSF